ncbi:MAG: hypothetical protein M0Z31_14930 [Clostridia bacterium]|nr:hypothetical protein [Clostridia bacterium]
MRSQKYIVAFIVGFLISLLAAVPGSQAQTKLEQDSAVNDGCLRCHGAQGLKTKQDGKVVSLWVNEEAFGKSIHGTNSCTSCHQGYTDFPHQGTLKGEALSQQTNARCRECHADVTKVYMAGAHGKALSEGKKTALCSDCHGIHNIRKHEDPSAMVYKNNIPHTCTKCHEGRIAISYEESFHGKAVLLGSQKSPSCADCHGSHDILGPKAANSPVNKNNIPDTCAKCHRVPYENFAKGTEHFVLEKGGPGEPMFYTLKFFVWLTIIVITLLIIHMELELYRKLKKALEKRKAEKEGL